MENTTVIELYLNILVICDRARNREDISYQNLIKNRSYIQIDIAHIQTAQIRVILDKLYEIVCRNSDLVEVVVLSCRIGAPRCSSYQLGNRL